MSTAAHAYERQVSWVLDEIPITGTLTRPSGVGPFPAVIFVAGSGPTDRDWNTPAVPGINGSAALLAQTLTASGYVTLRYDKRASGPHAVENVQRLMGTISMQGHAAELAGGVHLLAQHPDVDRQRIVILANSEGCIHALNYQLQAPAIPCAGLALTAAPGRPISKVVRSQVAAQLADIPGGDELLAAFDVLMQDFVTGRAIQAEERFPEVIRILILGLTNPANQPFARELWATDPAELLAGLRTPTLVVIGKKDIQVDWQADGRVFMDLATQHPNITVHFPEQANHVLKHEPRPRAQLTAAEAVASYNAANAVLDPDTVTRIMGWLAGLW
jgi:pimeloyl-ACP methyl ester carboxylesterase